MTDLQQWKAYSEYTYLFYQILPPGLNANKKNKIKKNKTEKINIRSSRLDGRTNCQIS